MKLSDARPLPKRRGDACALLKLSQNKGDSDGISHGVLWECDASAHAFKTLPARTHPSVKLSFPP